MGTTMTQIRDVMTERPVGLPTTASVRDAARAMRESNIGDVMVLKGEQLCGIVTDRDIVVRAIAEGRDPESVTLEEICSDDVTSLSPDDRVDDAVKLMRRKAVRRLPVVDGGRPVGVVSIGDLAVQRDEHSALADISAASPNT